ncbi:C6 transcription factor [Pyrenophora tritici-repentis]|nr:C6 transcription factor [Pyrenophora tritici-repentis]
MFFGTRSNKKDLLRNGDYIILLQSFTVTLSKWYDEFEASHSDVVQDVQRLLLIEYHNLKTYTHALAIQAILERAHSQNFTCSRRDRLELLSTCYLPEDFTFIHEVITNSNIILQTTISMAANGRLRFIPIRQLQCIMSAFVFLFKAIKLCTSREDVQTSLVVLEQCVKALGEADVDEMDLSRGTQEFLHSQVQTIREDANGLFSASTDHGQALGAQVMADTGEPPALDAMTASQSLLLGVNWNQDTLMMLGVPADLATSWSSLDASGRLTVADPLWQSVGFPWDASG